MVTPEDHLRYEADLLLAAHHRVWIIVKDDRGEPWIAHRVASHHDHYGVACEVTDCGIHYPLGHKKIAYWYVPVGELPLAVATMNHCGLDPIDLTGDADG